MDALTGALANAGALVVLAVALLMIARTLRQDVAGDLARRVSELEKSSARQVARIHQLEEAMREGGVPVPPWPEVKEKAA